MGSATRTFGTSMRIKTLSASGERCQRIIRSGKRKVAGEGKHRAPNAGKVMMQCGLLEEIAYRGTLGTRITSVVLLSKSSDKKGRE